MSNPIQQAIEALKLANETSYSEANCEKFNAALSALQSLQGGELPPLLPSDHPEPHTLVWSKVEIEAIQAYARTAVATAMARGAVPQLDDGPPGSGGWKAHAESMERERNYWKQRAQTMYEHQRGEVWYWQDDGNDHPESMCNSLPVVIRADALRALLAAAPTPEATQPTQDKLGDLTDQFAVAGNMVTDAQARGTLYCRLHTLSKLLESCGRIDEMEHRDAYPAILDAMAALATQPTQAEAPSEREAFEAWARGYGYQRDELDRCRTGIVGPEYYNANTETTWKAWQARAALATQPTQAEAPSEFPLSAWQTMEYAKRALNAMLTHMGMDEDEWNKPSFEQARSAVRTLEYQLQRADQVALWKARYQSLKGPFSKFHEQAVAAGFDGVSAVSFNRLVAEREADRAAMKEALEALKYHTEQTRPITATQVAIHSLQKRLSPPSQA